MLLTFADTHNNYEVNQTYVLFPVWSAGSTNPQNNDIDAAFDGKEHDFDAMKPESVVILSPSSSTQSKEQNDKTKKEDKGKSPVESVTGYRYLNPEFQDCSKNSSNKVNAAGSTVSTVGKNYLNITNTFSAAGPSNDAISPTYGKTSDIDASQLPDDPDLPELEDIIYSDDEDVVGTEADFNNLESSIPEEPNRVHQALKDPSWIKAMQEDLLQFKMQKVWVLVDLPYEKRAISTKWVYRNKKDKRVTRIEAIRLFLAYASFMGFMVYQMDVKSAFLYGTIEEEVYVCQPPWFEDPDHPNKVYRVVKALYGLHQAPTAWYETLATYLLENDDIIFGATNKDLGKSFKKLMKDKFKISSMGELTFFLGLQVKQKKDGIFISQDKYVAEILRKFGLTERKLASTPIDTKKPLLKDPDGEDVDVHIYRSIIGSLMYLTSSRPDIMFAVCVCACFQVTPKASHLHAVKRIFRYLKGKPHLGLWYPKDSPFDLVAYSDSDYAGASLDRKSTTGGCQFLGCRLISWQCKKQTVVGTSSTEAEYVAAASCCTQVPWIQNLLLDYGDALHLDDAEGVNCLPNEEIFAELARVIEEEGNADEQVQDVAADTAAQGANTVVQGDAVHELSIPSPTLPTLPPQQTQDLPSTSQRRVKKLEKANKVKVLKLRRLKKVGTSQRINSSDDTVMEDASNQGRMIDALDSDAGVALMDDKEAKKKAEEAKEDEPEVQEVVDVVTTAKLITEVVTATSESVIAASELVTAASTTIAAAEP
nr:hypothetical protein [Tanacetum cinerariifolium]